MDHFRVRNEFYFEPTLADYFLYTELGQLRVGFDANPATGEQTWDFAPFPNTVAWLDAMAALPPAKFERVLHPVFEQDEATLIAALEMLNVRAARLRRALPCLHPLLQNPGISHVITGLRTQWHFTQCVTCEPRLALASSHECPKHLVIRGPDTARPCAAAPEGYVCVCASPPARAHVPGLRSQAERERPAVVVSSAEIDRGVEHFDP